MRSPPIEKDGEEPGGKPREQGKRQDVADQSAGNSHEERRTRRRGVTKTHRHRVARRRRRERRRNVSRRWRWRLVFNGGRRRNQLALRFSAFMAEKRVGRKLRAAGAIVGHDYDNKASPLVYSSRCHKMCLAGVEILWTHKVLSK